LAYDYDLFVIGAGSGGVRAARVAAQHGARVAIAEEDRVGGTCVIRGCIPKKLFVYASAFREAFEDAQGYGWTVDKAAFDWPTLMANKDREIDRLNGIYIANLKAAGAELMPVRAELEDAHTVRLGDGRRVTAATILIATGALPSLNLAVPGAELAISSNEAFHLPELPRRVVIAGGGYIAVEFAGIFNGLGCRDHAGLPARHDPARLRRRREDGTHRGDDQEGDPDRHRHGVSPASTRPRRTALR
jgi:glutathione reductase (NADPH)